LIAADDCPALHEALLASTVTAANSPSVLSSRSEMSFDSCVHSFNTGDVAADDRRKLLSSDDPVLISGTGAYDPALFIRKFSYASVVSVI
jgi:hypothetical protein